MPIYPITKNAATIFDIRYLTENKDLLSVHCFSSNKVECYIH